MDLVQAADAPHVQELELDACGAQFNALAVDVAFLFSKSAPYTQLRAALVKTLPNFGPVAGRMVKRGDKTIVLCNNAGVPFTYQSANGFAPTLDAPLASHLFDFVSDWVPTGDTPADAPTRIKVTDFADGQIIALSISHGIADAYSINQFMSSWAAAYNCKELPNISHDRSPLPPQPAGFGATPLVSSEGIPEGWGLLFRGPFSMPGLAPYPASITTYRRTAEACQDLKRKYATEDINLSTNDVLCGELTTLLDLTK
eukprot:gene15851-18800_t